MIVAALDALTVMDTMALVIPTAATTKTWGQTSDIGLNKYQVELAKQSPQH